MFRRGWWYFNESMSVFKGKDVEVRYKDDDYSRVWVILPNDEICAAELITRSSLINPNKRTLEVVAKAQAHERRLIREYDLIAQSNLRDETTEDRVAQELNVSKFTREEREGRSQGAGGPAVTLTTPRMPNQVSDGKSVTASDVADAEDETLTWAPPPAARVSEFEDDDE